METRTSMDLLIRCRKDTRYYQVFFASNSVAEAAFQNRGAYDTANIYVNQFLRTGNCLPRKQGGANHLVMSDWIEAYIEALLLCNPMLYLSEIRERVEDDLQLQPHGFRHYLPFVYVSKD